MRIYADGVFDLLHHGHGKLFENIKKEFPDSHLIVGVHSDINTIKFKGPPVLKYEERVKCVSYNRYVNEVIRDVDWIITEDFIEKHSIDLVVHDGTPYICHDDNGNVINDTYSIVKSLGKFHPMEYTSDISTSEIIQRILDNKCIYQARNEKKGHYELHPSLYGEQLVHLREGQKKMTGLFREFDRICRKYDIKYWCKGGTMIGVVRHKGWIPWDGDVDIGMLESDYEMFKTKAFELPSNMFFQNIDNDPFYTVKGIYKIRDINSYYSNKKYPWHDGLQLDIFVHTLSEKNMIIPVHNGRHGDLGEHMYDDIFPLATGQFEDLVVYIPGNYVGICKQFWKDFPPKVLDVINRKPHEGNMISDKAHEQDVKNYPHLYGSIEALSSSREEVSEQEAPAEFLQQTYPLLLQEYLL
jgi:choline-phosphate cytidylyltransferase